MVKKVWCEEVQLRQLVILGGAADKTPRGKGGELMLACCEDF